MFNHVGLQYDISWRFQRYVYSWTHVYSLIRVPPPILKWPMLAEEDQLFWKQNRLIMLPTNQQLTLTTNHLPSNCNIFWLLTNPFEPTNNHSPTAPIDIDQATDLVISSVMRIAPPAPAQVGKKKVDYFRGKATQLAMQTLLCHIWQWGYINHQ